MSEESLQFSEGTSDKFWKIRLEGTSFTVHYGRVGTGGQTQTKSFDNETEAKKNFDKLVAEKLKKGYARTGQAVGAMPAATIVKEASAPAAKLEKSRSAGGADSSTAPSATALLENKSDSTAAQESPDPSSVDASSSQATDSSLNSVQNSAPSNISTKPASTGAFKSEKRNDLRPEELAFAAWNPLAPLPSVKQRPFDLAKLCEEFNSLDPEISTWAAHYSKKCPTPLHMTSEEASFWLEVMFIGPERINEYGANREKAVKAKRARMLSHLQNYDFSKVRTHSDLQAGFEKVRSVNYGVGHMNFIARLLVALWSDPKMIVDEALVVFPEASFNLMKVFRDFVAPRLSEHELNELRTYVRPRLNAKATVAAKPDAPEWSAYTVAAFLKMSEDVEQLVEAMPDEWLERDKRSAFHPQLYICSLPSREKIIEQAQRTKLYLGHGHNYYYSKGNSIDAMARVWLAVTGLESPDLLVEFAKRNSKEAAESMIAHFKLLNSQELAPVMLELLSLEHAKIAARKWLTEHSDWAVPYLFEASKGTSKVAEDAADILQGVSCRLDESLYSPELIAAVRDRFRLPDEGLEEFDNSNTPVWLARAIMEVKPGKTILPLWADPAVKPRIVIEKMRLNLEQMNAVLIALKQSSFETEHPLIQAIGKYVDRRQTEKFAWALFEAWLKNGADSKEKWAMGAIGFFGGDETVFKIVPLIKVWPGESQHPRAVFGLECLRTIGSDTALMQINSLSQKLQFKGLKQKAAECMEAIAQSRGMSKNELEDRIIPDCGLDEKGQRIFDFGSRQFKFALGSDLKAMIREPDGKLKSDLPKPNTKDDADKSKLAVEDWKLLKQQIKDIAKIQAVRMEQAMVTGRFWTSEDFKRFLVHHPLMIHIVRMLVWGEFQNEKLVRSFRVTEDQTFSDAEDRDIELHSESQIRVVHAMLLGDEEKAKWQSLLLDYEIIPPFKQLERPIYRLEPAELEELELTRFKDNEIPAISMVGIFDRQGWRRGVPEDGGCFYSHSKYFPGAKIAALAIYQGVPVGYMMEADPQRVESCFFFKADSDKVDMYFDSRKMQRIPLGKVDPIVLSEVLHDLILISAKSETSQ